MSITTNRVGFSQENIGICKSAWGLVRHAKNQLNILCIVSCPLFGALAYCLVGGTAFAQLTYVDADFSTNTGPAAAFAGSVTEPEGLWGQRAFATDGTIIESSGVGSGSEDSPEIFTTLDGLDAEETYLIYAHFWSDGSPWNIRAGFSSGNLTLFAPPGVAEDIDATPGVLASELDYEMDPLFTEDNRTMYAGQVGATQANPSGEITVYIDDLPGDVNTRSWYDGLSFEVYNPLTLQVNTTTGSASIMNTTSEAINLNYYLIGSEQGALDPTGWSSLDDQDFDAGLAADFDNSNSVDNTDLDIWKVAYGTDDTADANGDGVSDGQDFLIWQTQFGRSPGDGDSWAEAGGSDSNQLAELFLSGATMLAPGESINLGNAYDTSVFGSSDGDLTFQYAGPGGSVTSVGVVQYVSSVASVPEPTTLAGVFSSLLMLFLWGRPQRVSVKALAK